MDRIAHGITRHRKIIIIIFVVISLISAVATMMVKVNYNMTDYLPENAQSTKALEIMKKEFNQAMTNANVMIKNVSIMEAVEYKEKIKAIDGVEEALWLDDVADIKRPLETIDSDLAESYYKNGNALISVAIEDGREGTVCDLIRELIGEENALSGEAADTDAMQKSTGKEVANAVVILVPLIILLLVLSTNSWLEPVLFLAAIGVSVIINMGTNLIFGEVSFMTNSVTPILQLAVSLDYAIFLLHSFASNREKYDDIEIAMQNAIKDSIKTVSASAMTTLFGFLALVFMEFRIGSDLGLSLAKGIVFSFLSVVVFLPALTLSLCKLLDKTNHRPLIPDFKNTGRILTKLSVPAIILVVIIIVPSFLGQGQTAFIYGNGDPNPSARVGRDTISIREEFGENTTMALLVPRGDVAKEQELSQELDQLDSVKSVLSYSSAVDAAIPPEYLGESVSGQFYSENYSRLVVTLDTPQEGDLAFKAVENIQDIARKYYGDDAYSVGQSANLYDMKTIIQQDNVRVNLLAIIAIFFVLLATFKSALLPIILLLTIETAIWINMAIPYFAGLSINFIGYLVISTVQLGATVDYAILLTDNYMNRRRLAPRKEAVSQAIGDSFKSILISATTLSVAGFTLSMTSTDMRVSDIGLLLGRGALISTAMVLCFLPAMLSTLDKAIGKLTWRSDFYKNTY